MPRFTPLALAIVLACGSLPATAQTTSGTAASTSAQPASSALDGELFYQLLLGELNARSNEPGAGYALILDAARKTNDAKLYQRAVEIAFQSRSGDAALQAARAWREAQPGSREANRFVMQILIALNRLAESAEPLRAEITAFLDSIENGTEPPVTGEDGRRALALAVGVLEKIESHASRLSLK